VSLLLLTIYKKKKKTAKAVINCAALANNSVGAL